MTACRMGNKGILVLSLKPIFYSLICVGWMPEKLVKSSTTFYKIKLELISLGGLISAGDAVVVHPSNKLSSVNILLSCLISTLYFRYPLDLTLGMIVDDI